MTFDITNIDKIRLLKLLYQNSKPIGLGIGEYLMLKNHGEEVEKLSNLDCENAIYEFSRRKNEYYRLFDYHNGKPLKIDFIRKLVLHEVF
ncbi:MAG: hypothetical protein ACK5MH_07310 [Bacteroidales bacterium]